MVLKTEHDCKQLYTDMRMCESVCLCLCVFDVYYVVFRTYHCLLPYPHVLALCFVAFMRFAHSCTNTYPFIGCHFCGRLINYGFSFRSYKISSKRNTYRNDNGNGNENENATLYHRYKYRKLVDGKTFTP